MPLPSIKENKITLVLRNVITEEVTVNICILFLK